MRSGEGYAPQKLQKGPHALSVSSLLRSPPGNEGWCTLTTLVQVHLLFFKPLQLHVLLQLSPGSHFFTSAQVTYNPDEVSFEKLLDVFWDKHDREWLAGAVTALDKHDCKGD